jgi:hypothetical protein
MAKDKSEKKKQHISGAVPAATDVEMHETEVSNVLIVQESKVIQE